jgi:hypothetical protein
MGKREIPERIINLSKSDSIIIYFINQEFTCRRNLFSPVLQNLLDPATSLRRAANETERLSAVIG